MDVVHDLGEEMSRVAVASSSELDRRASPAFAWLVVGLGAWLMGGVTLVVWATNGGLVADAGASPYHVPAWLALAAACSVCLSVAVPAVRRGTPWRAVLPDGYGVFGAGVLVLLAYLVVDVAWREGVGIDERSLEGGVAPSRILLIAGLMLVVCGPLRAALRGSAVGTARTASIPSAALVLAVLGLPAAFNPVVNPRFERTPPTPQEAAEVWVMDADGGHQTRLIEARDGIEAGWPAWSPDGRWVAYVRWYPGPPPNDLTTRDADVWIAAADGSQRRLLVGGPGWQWMPRWSPDGTWIAYTQEAAGGPWLSTGPLGPDAGPQGPGFIAGSASVRTDADIWVIAADGSREPRRLTGGPGDDRSASWSPDGGRLAFDTTRDGNTELYTMAADGSDVRRLTDDPAEDWGTSWSPNGDAIAFASARDSLGDIYLIDPDSGAVRPVTHDVGWAKGPTWSPDATRLAFTAGLTGEEDVYSIALDGSDMTDLTRSPGTVDGVWDGMWGPEGRILFGRSGNIPAESSGLVQDDFAALMVLVQALLAAGMVAVVLRIRPPFGAFAAILGLGTLVVAAAAEQWRFVPFAALAGLAVDVAVRYAPAGRASIAGPAVAAGAYVLAITAAAAATTGLAWTPTVVIGIATLAAGLGGLLGALARRDPVPPRGAPADAGG